MQDITLQYNISSYPPCSCSFSCSPSSRKHSTIWVEIGPDRWGIHDGSTTWRGLGLGTGVMLPAILGWSQVGERCSVRPPAVKNATAMILRRSLRTVSFWRYVEANPTSWILRHSDWVKWKKHAHICAFGNSVSMAITILISKSQTTEVACIGWPVNRRTRRFTTCKNKWISLMLMLRMLYNG